MEKLVGKVDVLDKGYVMLRDYMGSDLTIVNAARASYAKASEALTDKDKRLIKFLAREGHLSPFRHVVTQWEFNAPLMVARQHWKYVVGAAHLEATGDSMEAWNESSRRYVTEEPSFYVPNPDEWRTAPENSKQGSGEPINILDGKHLTTELLDYIERGERLYHDSLEAGICAEQARLFLPAYGMYVKYYWTASLQSVCHFLTQRLEEDAQVEIQLYAKAVLELIKDVYPESITSLVKTKE